VLADFLRIARERFPADELASIADKLIGTARLPPQLDPALADELPESAGVYLFYGENEALLYVGKAKNLANRVLAHFANTRAKLEQQLTTLVRRIEWIETAGEFGALVTEARLIKSRKPVFNRRLRASSELWAICLRVDATPPIASIEMLDSVADSATAYGMFRRQIDAERALEGLMREHGLCAKWLGLERGEGSCIGFQIGRCRGVCAGKELPALHAVRVRLALSGLKRRDWPFPGRIGIRERDWRGVEETLVFDRWCYDGEDFDPDIYRILTGFLDRPARGAELLTRVES
jgi:DNA polymerase-3 subunit epsilon